MVPVGLVHTVETRRDVPAQMVLEERIDRRQDLVEPLERLPDGDAPIVARTASTPLACLEHITFQLFEPGSELRWTLPIAPQRGTTFDFEMRASRGWKPRKEGRNDDRELALQVIRMFFRRAGEGTDA